MGLFQRIQDSLGWSEASQYDYVYDANQDADYDNGYDAPTASAYPTPPSPQAVPGASLPPTVNPMPAGNPANNNIVAMPGLGLKHVEFMVLEPDSFEDMPRAIAALRERKAVILNLDRMDPDQAQRAVDYVAGGTFAIDGDQERLGETIFLFTPSFVHINRAGSTDTASHSAPAAHNQPVQQPRSTSSGVPPFVPNTSSYAYPPAYSQQQY
ncbi:MAG: cell division protein SepF [Thainema sp.]